MRSDIAKVITERPRKGGGLKAPKGEVKASQRGLEEMPKREGMRKKWQQGWNGKESTDVIGPLEGFLRKNCGRPWNKVFSEVSAVLPASGGVSLTHARDHLFQMVELHTQIIDGELCDSKRHPIRSWVEFYVCPKGFLRHQPRKKFRWDNKQPTYKQLASGEFLIEDEREIWWACHVIGNASTFPEFPLTLVAKDGKQFLCYSKRQLGKREIKKYGLRQETAA